ncbi:inner membrane-spanning protein YciB [Ruixingdingia sedimenti]|uniref:Inner membrane-spanning protein YciB n=1 Tax=Ruixingdingia sedimenti TaxID=3073604 RepID=A0ABU1F6P3_9RHOB|nr:inner membrane-spanning protein YciB [Xinfangfangia sp. LG-4]MDR5652499.1 inner membrane-spanning protein YciB [Xinfangfangia sp. LG-4]
MAERPVKPWVKMALELGPVAAFFAGYLRLRDQVFTIGGTEYDGFIVVTAAFIPLMVACTGVLWALTGRLSRMQVATVVLVVVFGGMSVWLNDERFFKMKPTIIYALFAGVLGLGLMRGQSYLASLMGEMLPLRPEGWMILTRRLALFFAGLAVANEAVWRLMSTDAWVNFKTFGLTAALFGFFMAQGGLLRRYGMERDGDA